MTPQATDHFRRRLLALERELSSSIEQARTAAREPSDDSPGDAADESVEIERKDTAYRKTEADEEHLSLVRAALRRLDEGTFGRCLVDGEPIEEARLEAIPWAPRCVRHAELEEASHPRRRPTL